jgi:hypothetical protein
MTEDQTTEIIIALKEIAMHLADIADSKRSLAADSLSSHEAYAAAALPAIISIHNTSEARAAEIAFSFANAMLSEARGED